MKYYCWLYLVGCLVACTADVVDAPKDTPIPTTMVTDSQATKPFTSPYKSSYHDVKAVVTAWNKGINDRDLELLKSTYAEEVYFFGKKMSRAETLRRKKRVLDNAPLFAQSLADIKIQRLYTNTQEAFFNKSYQDDSIHRTVVGILALYDDPEHGWKITQESDDINRKKQGNKVCSCSEFLVALYNGGDASVYKNIRFFDGEPYYISNDDKRYLFVYPDAEEVVFMEKENQGQHAAAMGAAQIFSLTDKKMRSDTYSDKCDVDVPLNERFLERMGEFCR